MRKKVWKVASCPLVALEDTLNDLDTDGYFVVQILEATANGTVPIVCKRVVSDFEEVRVKTIDEFRADCGTLPSDEAIAESLQALSNGEVTKEQMDDWRQAYGEVDVILVPEPSEDDSLLQEFKDGSEDGSITVPVNGEQITPIELAQYNGEDAQ